MINKKILDEFENYDNFVRKEKNIYYFKCNICGNEFKRYISQLYDYKGRNILPKYCSRICLHMGLKKYDTDSRIPFIMEDYENGISSNVISEKYNINATTILNILKTNGITIRTTSESCSGGKNGMFNRHHTAETKDKLKKITIEYYKKHPDEIIKRRNDTLQQKIKIKNTKIEIKLSNVLKELNIRNYEQEILGFWSFDFYLPQYNVYIECDGDYWHGNPKFYSKEDLNKTQLKNIANDKRKSTYCENNNIILLRFWEYDILNNTLDVKNKILETVNSVGKFSNIRQENVFKDIKRYDDNSMSTIMSDVPYNLGSTWIIDNKNKPKIYGKGSDFMNKWENLNEYTIDVFFKESFRILKYGGYILIFGLDRQLMPFTYYAVKNGFEVQQSLYWYSIQNFPKATDVSKGIDKRFGLERNVVGKKTGRASKPMTDIGGNNITNGTPSSIDCSNITEANHDLAKKYDGYKYSVSPLKQVLETVLVFRKPIKNKSILDDVIESETDNEISPSILDIDGNRVSYKSENDIIPQIRQNKRDINSDRVMYGGNSFEQSKTKATIGGSRDGRYPSQMFIECMCDKVIEEGDDKKPFEYKDNEYIAEGFINNIKPNSPSNYNDAHKKIIHTNPECPCAILDRQHGNVKGGSVNAGVEQGFGGSSNTYGDGVHTNEFSAYGDVGGASKVLQQIKYEEDEFDLLFYNSKVSSKERNEGLEDLEKKERLFNGKSDKSSKEMKDVEERFTTSPSPNNHPTLKPISLIERISSLFKLPEECDQKVYIPFSGVFSEIIGFVKAGYKIDNIYGCELSEDYYNIGLKRLEHYTKKFNKPKSSLEKFL